ncbi:putative integral membrane protein [Babesia bovis T2Bo]|uniref:putative integral membrane protein n=1 Tax=Babesia bovis T2Bo TaxID=484906 RepID=UPI001C352642|nr:putative integral membrane protein [Babesia bovis T2Bo]EDO06123.2 putative integral membrane protein [Babesia bovis T2Bo]
MDRYNSRSSPDYVDEEPPAYNDGVDSESVQQVLSEHMIDVTEIDEAVPQSISRGSYEKPSEDMVPVDDLESRGSEDVQPMGQPGDIEAGTGVCPFGFDEHGRRFSEEGPVETEEGLFVNPFDTNMDDLSYKLRMFALLGFLPFFWIGWVIGAIYGAVSRKTKQIHKKLSILLFGLSVVGAAVIIVTTSAIYLSLKSVPATPKLTKAYVSENPLFPFLDYEPAVAPGILPEPDAAKFEAPVRGKNDFFDQYQLTSEKNQKTILMVMRDMPIGWYINSAIRDTAKAGYNVYAANIHTDWEAEADPDGTEEYYGLKKIKVMFDKFKIPIKGSLYLAMVLNRKDAELFKPSVSPTPLFEGMVLINNEELDKSKIPVLTEGSFDLSALIPKVASHAVYINTEMTCPDKRLPPLEVTIDGTKDYSYKRGTFDELSALFFTNYPESKWTKPYPRKLVPLDTKIEQVFAKAVKDLIAYRSLVDSPDSKLQLCAKAKA